jgi:hypothetical protein
MPTSRSVSQIKSALLHPATTSHFELELKLPSKLNPYLNQNGIKLNSVNFDRLQLMCSEATLPGSNMATLEINNDFHGVTERHAYRRIYDDRIDLTFYVDAQYYLPIRVFETWMKYIAQEASDAGQPDKGDITSRNSNYFYRFNYPDNYIAESMSVVKFEKSSLGGTKGIPGTTLRYNFIRTYPISITSMPVSYDSSSLLKCTVSMSYIRYVLDTIQDPPPQEQTGTQNVTPIEQAAFNGARDYLLNPQFGVDSTGSLSRNATLASGNSIQQYDGEEIIGAVNANQRPVEAGLPYVGRNVGPLAP